MLGIDTSAYTTSVAAVCVSGQWHQARRVLAVPQGKRGLKPSEAVFGHVKNLPELVEKVMGRIDRDDLVGVSVSVAPRPNPASYLPPFLAGEGVARAIASVAQVPLWRTTHQEGHIRAGLAGTGLNVKGAFYAFHLSGGTTELLSVTPEATGFRIETVASTDDLYVGQFVDRIGVRMGFGFPAGPELDRLSQSGHDVEPIPWSRPRLKNGLWRTSFSGPEAAAQRALDAGCEPGAVARGVLESIAQGLALLVKRASPLGGDLLVVGGVAANTRLRRRMRDLLADAGWRLWFSDPEWSRDNAVGVAYLGLDALRHDRGDLWRHKSC